MNPLVLTVLVLCFAIAALLLVMVIASIRADHSVTISGPMKTVDELDAQIVIKRGTLVDLDEDLARRRESLQDLSKVGAEVDALENRKAELLSEEQQMAARRQEILDIREETASAQTAQQEATRELNEAKDELKRVENELAEGRRLAGQIDSLTQQQQDLNSQIIQLRQEHLELTTMKAQENELRTRVHDLTREEASLAGRIDGQKGKFESLKVELEQVRADVAAELKEHGRLSSGLEVVRSEDRRLQGDIESKTARVAQMEARLDELKQESAGRSGAEASALAQDWRDQFRTLPPALQVLGGRSDRPRETEDAALHRVESHLKAQGLSYSRRTIKAFHTAMKVNDTTQMAVLAGISGTGKSQLPRRYAEAMGMAFLHVPVQPRWDSPQDLMGFYNYIEGRFRPTDMAQALYHMDGQNGPKESRNLQGRMLLILLDEMNLARVEYYFSDFLSRLESRPSRNEVSNGEARKDAEIELDMPVPDGLTAPRIFPGYNILFAGTMNEDESTQSLSEKVVDRANVLRFAAPRQVETITHATASDSASEALLFDQWEGWHKSINKMDRAIGDSLKDHIFQMIDLMRKLQRPIGHRLAGAIGDYVVNYPGDNNATDIRTALADQVEMRLLPKLRGIETDILEQSSGELTQYVEKLGDTELSLAITESIDQSRMTGQFVWRGVTRR